MIFELRLSRISRMVFHVGNVFSLEPFSKIRAMGRKLIASPLHEKMRE